MSIFQFTTAYDQLSRGEQTRYLAYLAHCITLAIRDCYSDNAQIVNSHSHSPAGCLNEIQHRITGYISLLLDNAPHRPTGRDIVQAISAWAKYGRITPTLIYTIDMVISNPIAECKSGAS